MTVRRGMICPYRASHCITVQRNNLDEERDYTDKIYIGTVFIDRVCVQKKCAAWDERKERCRYNA